LQDDSSDAVDENDGDDPSDAIDRNDGEDSDWVPPSEHSSSEQSSDEEMLSSDTEVKILDNAPRCINTLVKISLVPLSLPYFPFFVFFLSSSPQLT